MKIFVLGTRGFPDVQGGIERHCEELYPRLVRFGCQVTVLTRSGYIFKDKRIRENQGVNFIHVWAPRNKYLEALSHTFFGIIIARIHSPDIVHIHAVGPSVLVPFARILGFRVIMTHHGPDYLRKKWGGFAKFILRLGEYLGVRYAEHVIAVSKTVGVELRKRFKGARISYIPNGVNIPKKSTNNRVLEEFGLKPQQFIFTACRFVPEKGLHDLITAYSSLNQPKFKLVIAGDADHETIYSKKIKNCAKQNNNVVMTGFLNHAQLSAFYANAKLFVLPSYYEGLPIALLEAMSYNVPVLVSDIKATREIPLPEYRYFPVHDRKILAEKITELSNHPLSMKEVNANRKIIRENYNWQKIAEQTRFVYGKVCNPRSLR
ncbi:MAG: glycosyltransferase family 4 protein [bacterium]